MTRRLLSPPRRALAALARRGAEPLSRAQAVARALEKNPDILRSLADRDGLRRPRARRRKADALPEVNVYGLVPPLPGPGLPQQPQHRPVPARAAHGLPSARHEPVGRLRRASRQTLWSFSLGKAIRAAHYATHLGEENVRTARQDVALRAVFAYNDYLLALEQVKVAETGRPPEGEAARDVARTAAAAGVATDLEVLRFEVDLANARTTSLRSQGAADLARGRPERGHGAADRHADRAHGRARVPWRTAADQQQVVREAIASRPEVKAVELEREDLRRGDRHLQGRHAAPARLQRRLRLVRAGHRQLLRAELQEVEPSASPSRSRSSTAGAPRARSPRPGPNATGSARTAWPSRPRSTSRRSRPWTACAWRASVFRAADLNVDPGAQGPRHDRGQLPPRRRDHPRRARRPGRPRPGRVQPGRGAHAHANARAGLRYVMGQDPLDDSAPAAPSETPEANRGRHDDAAELDPSSSTLAAPPRLAACGLRRRAPTPPPRRRAACRCARPSSSKRDLADDVVLTGTLRPRAQVQVVAEVPARLLRVLKDEGARVAKGEVLAVLDETDYRLAHDRAKAALAVAEANRAHALAEKERADNLLKTGGITDKDHLSAAGRAAGGRGLAGAGARRGGDRRRSSSRARRSGRRSPGASPSASPTRARCSRRGAPLFTLVDDSVLEFRAPVALRRLRPKVKLGARGRASRVGRAPRRCTIQGRVARRRAARRRAVALLRGGGRGAGPGRTSSGGLFARAAVRVGRGRGRARRPPGRAGARRLRPRARREVFVVRQGKAEKVDGRRSASRPRTGSRRRAASRRATRWCSTRPRPSPPARRSTAQNGGRGRGRARPRGRSRPCS